MSGDLRQQTCSQNSSSSIRNNVVREHENHNMKLVRSSIIAGSAAGSTAALLFHPMDLLRTKMQSSVMLSTVAANGASSCSSSSAMAASTVVSPWSTLRGTLQYGGIRALYTGLSLPLVAQAAYKSCVFTTNTLCKSALLEFKTQEKHKVGIFSDAKFSKLTIFDLFLCGGAGGMANGFLFVTPVELVRNQLIAQDMELAKGKTRGLSRNHISFGVKKSSKIMRGPVDVVRRVLLKDGLSGMWRGANVTILRDSFGCGLYFVAYEVGKDFFTRTLPAESSNLITLLAGACAGTGFWVVALPLDMIKTNIQTGKTESIVTALKDLAGKKGVVNTLGKLYSGWQLAFGRGAPSAAVTLYAYEMWMNFLSSE